MGGQDARSAGVPRVACDGYGSIQNALVEPAQADSKAISTSPSQRTSSPDDTPSSTEAPQEHGDSDPVQASTGSLYVSLALLKPFEMSLFSFDTY